MGQEREKEEEERRRREGGEKEEGKRRRMGRETLSVGNLQKLLQLDAAFEYSELWLRKRKEQGDAAVAIFLARISQTRPSNSEKQTVKKTEKLAFFDL